MATKEAAVDALISAFDAYVIEQADNENRTPTSVKRALRQALLDFVDAAVAQPEDHHIVAHCTLCGQEASRQAIGYLRMVDDKWQCVDDIQCLARRQDTALYCKGCLREHVLGHCLPADV